MSLSDIPQEIWLIVATAFGGLALKMVEKWLNRNADRRDERRELRDQLNSVQSRLDKVEEEVTFWRTRFYEEQEDNYLLRSIMIINGMNEKVPQKAVAPPGPPGVQ